MDSYPIIKRALLTMPEPALQHYIATVWREAVLSGKVMVCGHQPGWMVEDKDGYPYCAMCRVAQMSYTVDVMR